jgi:hypothetical protein
MDKLTRRNFLFGISKFGIATGMIDIFLEQIILGRMNKLLAADGLETCYLGIYLPGGPPQWMLAPLENNPTVSKGVGTSFSSDGLPSYELNENLTPIWSDVEGLKSNVAFIRGVQSLPIHSEAGTQWSPQSAYPGIHALASLRNSTYPIPCIQWGIDASLNHPEKRSSAVIYTNLNVSSEEDILREIISPFDSKSVSRINDDLGQKIEKALGRLVEMGNSYNINAQKMKHEVISAKALIQSGLSGLLDTGFSEIVDEYNQVVNMNGVQAELDFLELGPYSGANKDLWKISSDHNLKSGDRFDSSQGVNNTMVASLAISHFIFENNLSNSLLMSGGVLDNIGVTNNDTFTSQEITHDAHGVGGNAATFFFSKYYIGILKGLEKLKTNIFSDKNYVFHLGSEFSRSAKFDGSGSDHGTNSAVHTVISNKISTSIYGDIGTSGESDDDTYYGSWGQASGGGVTLKTVHWNIAKVIGVEKFSFEDYDESIDISTSSTSSIEKIKKGFFR